MMKKIEWKRAGRSWRRWPLFLILAVALGGCAGKWSTLPDRYQQERRFRQGQKEENLNTQAQSHFSFAMQLAREGRTEPAVAELKIAIQLDPNSAYLREVMAYLYLDLRKPQEALSWAQEAIRLNPERASAYNLAGLILLDLDQPGEAETSFRAACAKAPDSTEYAINLADSLLRQNQPQAALEVLFKFSKAHPDQAEPQYYIAVIQQALGQTEEAAQRYKQVLAMAPGFYPAWHDLFLLEAKRGNFQAAAEYGRTMMSMYPGDDDSRMALADVLIRAGADDEALAVLEDGKQAADQLTPQWWIEKGFILLRLERYENAREEFEGAIALDPENLLAVYGLGLVEVNEGKEEQAISYFEAIPKDSELYLAAQGQLAGLALKHGDRAKAIAIMEKIYQDHPNNLDVALAFAALLRDAGEYDRSEQVLTAALQKKPNNEDLLYELGLLYQAEGRTEDSLTVMEKILQKNPKSSRALNFIGFTWAEQGVRLDEAEAKIQEALKLDPGSGPIMDSLGWVYYQRGDYQTALVWLQKAERAAGPDPEILGHLGDCYLKLGKKDQARKAYQQALERCTDLKLRLRIEQKLGELK